MTLKEIAEYRRCYGSAGERAFLDHLELTLRQLNGTFGSDEKGNYFFKVGESSTMFTCHTDTCHAPDSLKEPARIKQEILLDDIGCYRLADSRRGDVGGFDDGTGIWILLEMIKAGKPGLYCFFRGEERGGIGSSWSARNDAERYIGINKAVAFDRPYDFEIITHQGGVRGASDDFAEALSEAFASVGMNLIPSDAGVYTDTAEFFDLVPECINLAVNYGDQHSQHEWQDAEFAIQMANAAIEIDWENLPVVRSLAPRSLAELVTSVGFDAIEWIADNPERAYELMKLEYYK